MEGIASWCLGAAENNRDVTKVHGIFRRFPKYLISVKIRSDVVYTTSDNLNNDDLQFTIFIFKQQISQELFVNHPNNSWKCCAYPLVKNGDKKHTS